MRTAAGCQAESARALASLSSRSVAVCSESGGFCLYPHILSSAAASDSGGFAFFRANSATFDVARYRTLSSQENIWDKEQREQ